MRNGRIVDNGPETPDSDDYSDSKGNFKSFIRTIMANKIEDVKVIYHK